MYKHFYVTVKWLFLIKYLIIKEDHEKYQENFKRAKLSELDFNEMFISSQIPCDFDRENIKSPCHFKACQKDDNDLKCLRYMLDYCWVFEDRGCVIQLPHLLNKLTENDYSRLKGMETEFG